VSAAALGIGALASVAGGVASGLSSKTTMPTMTPTGQALNSANSSFLTGILNDPQAGMGPIQTAGEQAINSSYAGSADTISRMMASRGYGSSGNMGNTMYQTDLSRLSGLSQYNGTMAQLESNRQMQASGDANQLTQINTGSTVSTPGAGLANGLTALGGASSNLGIMQMMMAMMGQNNNGGGNGGNAGYGGVGGYGITPSGTPTLINSSPGGTVGGVAQGGTSENGEW
jgi:hypothetical protein